MKTLKYLGILLLAAVVWASCTKEYSFEQGPAGVPADGTLTDNLGECQPVTFGGQFVKTVALTDSNFVNVLVNFSAAGSYDIHTDTANGFYFRGTSFVVDTGMQVIKLQAFGSPIEAVQTDFTVTFNNSFCTFSVPVKDSVVTPVTGLDYFPTTPTSNWTYTFPSSSDTLLQTVTEETTTINGNTYATFTIGTPTDGYDTTYYRKASGVYYEYSALSDFYDDTQQKVDFPFMKDNVATNTTWTSPEITTSLTDSTVGTVQGKGQIVFTLIAKDETITIGNTQIDSVIQVRRDYQFAPTATGTYQTIATADYYYQKGIGLIQITSSGQIVAYASRYYIRY